MPEVIDSFSGEYAFLSNFYEHLIEYMGFRFPSTENAYQAAKVDPCFREMGYEDAKGMTRWWKEHLTITPGRSKKLGRILPLRQDWDKGIKDAVMREVLAIKFSNPELRQKLLDTEEAKLIEGNWWSDHYWGVCKGVGKNRLGEELMYLRARIRLETLLN